MRWHVISVKPTGGYSSASSIWKVTILLAISLANASCQSLLLFSRFKWNASLTIDGISTPNLIFLLVILFLNLLINLFLPFRVCLTCHLKAGSAERLLLTAYSASSIGSEDLTIDRGCHDTYPSFHLIWMSQPLVVIIGFLIPSTIVNALSPFTPAIFSSFPVEMISSKRLASQSLLLIWSAKFSSFTLTEYSSILPSENSSS